MIIIEGDELSKRTILIDKNTKEKSGLRIYSFNTETKEAEVYVNTGFHVDNVLGFFPFYRIETTILNGYISVDKETGEQIK